MMLFFMLSASLLITFSLLNWFGVINVGEWFNYVSWIPGFILFSIAVCMDSDRQDKIKEQEVKIEDLQKEINDIRNSLNSDINNLIV